MPKSTTITPNHGDYSIAVIGGGISGLAAAHRLLELRPQAKVILLEARDRLGGVLQSERRDGFLIEHGADNFITTPPWATEFCERIGFDSELIQTNKSHRRAFVVHQGLLQGIPAGFAVMAPSRIWPIVSTPILSLRGKLRMAAEIFVQRRASDTSESLAAFVRRRFGREVYERLVQPLVAGIYTGDPEQLSAGATMPRFLQMEKEHGSLIRAMLKQRKLQRHSSKNSSGARYSQFIAPREGMAAFVQAIVDQLSNATIALAAPVERVDPTSHGGWKLSVGGSQHQTIDVDGVILATPARYSASLLQNVDTTLADEFAKIKYGSCALVSLGFRREQIGHALDGFGFVAPSIEGRKILSCSFSSVKYTGRAPDGDVLLRVFVGGACQQELVELDDQQLQKLVLQELSDLLAIRGQPKLCHITRQIQAMPQYYVGHEQRVQRIEERAEKLPNFALASNALHGIGIPNCIHEGEKAAEKVLAELPQPHSAKRQEASSVG